MIRINRYALPKSSIYSVKMKQTRDSMSFCRLFTWLRDPLLKSGDGRAANNFSGF